MTILSPLPASRVVRQRIEYRPIYVAPHAVSAPTRSAHRDALSTQRDSTQFARIAVGLIGASFAALAVLQAISLPVLDPIHGTISGMFYGPGGKWLFPTMGVLCVAGSAILAVALSRLGARKAAAVVVVWCVGLAAAALVPTDPPGTTAVSLAAAIHRNAAAVMFVAMPLAGLLVARARFESGPGVAALQRKLRRAAVTTALIGLGQIVVGIPSFFPQSGIATWPLVEGLYQVRGLAERALFVALILLVAQIGKVVIHVVSARDDMPKNVRVAALRR